MSTSQDPYKYFSIEARELLQQLEQGVLGIEKGADQATLVPRLLRCAHTLKGAARVVRHKDIAELAHTAEDVLVPFRDGSRAIDGGVVNQLLQLLDAMGRHVGALGSTATNGKAVHAPVEKSGEESFRTIRAEVAEVDALLAGIATASVQFNTIRSALRSLEQMQGVASVLVDQLTNSRSRSPLNGSHYGTDRARSLAEELGGLTANLGRNLLTCTERLDREMLQLRVAAEHLRLLPASTLFSSLERTARDGAQATGKRVAFEASGGDIRLDAHVLAQVHSALTQAVRNAIAHGIETETDRISAGKPPSGKITIEVSRRGSRVAFCCRDDGRGIDSEAVRQAMRKRGATAAEIDGLAAADVLKLVLRGGYSTARDVTEVSGRGIGMDVIREAAAQLGATVNLNSQLTRGTALEFVVAVSRTSFDALLVETNGAVGALPLDSVKRTLRVQPKDIVHAPTGDSILYEGKAIPYRTLSAAPGLNRAANESAVIVDGGGKVAAIGVDRLVGVSNIMQRPLPRFASTTAVVAGASLDVEGNPQIVFDPVAVVANAHNEYAPPATVQEQPSLPVLIIDDSLTTRMLEQSILESAGYTVEVATSAEEGLQKARLRRYALFLVDVEMPGMDGFTFVQTTRMDPALSTIPAILVTSRNLQEDFRRGEAVGASAYMVKSEFDQEKLLRIIGRLVGRNAP